MANLPQSPSINAPSGDPSPSNPAATDSLATKDQNMASAERLVLDLSNPVLRENALHELSKNKELFKDLAPMLWNSSGTITELVKEIVSIYAALAPPTLSVAQATRVCNVLSLLQCVASHPDTRMLFLNEHIPLCLYPFLSTTNTSRPVEYLRLTSLGVIGALVKGEDRAVIRFLLSTEIIPLCLLAMEIGCELSKMVATFIIQKILLDDRGLNHVCVYAERFFDVSRVLKSMVAGIAANPSSSRLLKHIILCYIRLADNPRAWNALRVYLPASLRDGTFNSCLEADPTTREYLQQLLRKLEEDDEPAVQVAGPVDPMVMN